MTVNTPKDWRNATSHAGGGDTSTPLSAVALEDMETRLMTPFNVQHYGALGDGSTDDTTAIQDALDAATAVGGTVFVPSGTYIVTTLTLKANTRLQGGGMGVSVLKLKNTTNVDLIQVAADASNVTVSDLSLDGNRANQGSDSRCLVTSDCTVAARNLVIDRVHVTGAYSKGLLLQSGTTEFLRQDTRVTNCRIADCGRSNIETIALHGLVIQGCTFTSWAQNIADEPAIWMQHNTTAGSYNVVIDSNHFYNTVSDAGWAIQSDVEAGNPATLNTNGCAITNNIFNAGASATAGGVGSEFTNTTIANNSFRNSGGGAQRNGIEVAGQNIVISGNTIEDGSVVIAAIDVQANENYTIANNSIINKQDNGRGIQMGNDAGAITDVLVTGNTVQLTHAGADEGIYIGTYATAAVINRVTVVGNRLYGNGGGRGIRLLAANAGTGSSGKILVNGNMVTSFNQGWRDDANDYHDEVTVSNNDFRGNTTAITHSATGGTYRFFGNVTADDQSTFLLSGGLGVGNSAAATEVIGKAVTQKIEIFGPTGTSLGYIPVYSSIS